LEQKKNTRVHFCIPQQSKSDTGWLRNSGRNAAACLPDESTYMTSMNCSSI